MALLLFGSLAGQAQLVRKDVPELRGIGIDEHLGETVPLDLEFVDERGNAVRLRDLFAPGKPVVLTLAYYECPMLCTFVLNGVSKAVKDLDLRAGEQFSMATISIDPDETAELARGKQARYLESIGGHDSRQWRFWVSPDNKVKVLADALGFRYVYDARQDEFAHSAVVFVLTDQGVISRYLYGIEHQTRDLRLALIEASAGKVGTIVDRIILFCYHYDPAGKRYVLMATNVMRLGGLVTVGCLSLFLGILWVKEKRRNDS